MVTNLAAHENNIYYRHNPPVNVADPRVVRFMPSVAPPVYDFLGGNSNNYPGCIVGYHGNDFAFGLGSQLLRNGKDINYAEVELGSGYRASFRPIAGMRYSIKELTGGRKLVVVTDCLEIPEKQKLDRKFRGWREELGFGDVLYALEEAMANEFEDVVYAIEREQKPPDKAK